MVWLINASQLDKLRKDQKNVVVLDATSGSTLEGKPAKEAYLEQHIIGARYFDICDFIDQDNPLPNMLMRDEEAIKKKIDNLGIANEQKIIFYDNSSAHTSCRALWMFKVFGHASSHLYVLDGGLNAWIKYGGKLESGEPRPAASKDYALAFQGHLIRTLVEMKMNLHHPREQVIDVRHPVRYAGGPEARPGLRAGHIPGSYSFPFQTMFESDGSWKPIDRIQKQLIGQGVELALPIVTTCGSGTTAPILNFALELMGQTDNAVYDGSWSEWGTNHLFPGETSLNERPVQTCLES